MAQTITDTLIETLQVLLEGVTCGTLKLGDKLNVPKDNLASWYAAMEFLRKNGVLQYDVTDNNGKPYIVSLSPIDEQYDLVYMYSNIDIENLKELCASYNIHPTNRTKRRMQQWLHTPISQQDTQLLIEVSPHPPDKLYDVELYFEGNSLFVISELGRWEITQSGRPAEILGVVATKACLNVPFSKEAISIQLHGKLISDPLSTIFRDNILRHELAAFADIKPDNMTVYSNSQLRESELKKVQEKSIQATYDKH